MFFKSFIPLVYPNRCIGCDDWHHNICSSCYSKLNFLKVPAHLPRLNKQYFENAYSALAYEGDVLEWIHQYKYHRQFHLIPALAHLLSESDLDWQSYDALAYVPLHWRRQIFRGFNPAHLLADTLGKKIKIPLVHVLKKTKHTKPQAKMDGEERLKNITSAFAPTKKAGLFVEKKRVLLIDDVLTTGATANECAHALKKSGAKSIDILTLARPL